jgi:hypothetical protein
MDAPYYLRAMPGINVVPLPSMGIPYMAGAVGLRYNRIPALVPPFLCNAIGTPLVTIGQLTAQNWVLPAQSQ